MSNKYLKPMLDTGSPRVFNCNEMSRKIIELDPTAELFFKNRQLNTIVLVKDTVPENERVSTTDPSSGTKLYFPFNENNIYEGGRTVFLHNKYALPAIKEFIGENAYTPESLESDMKLLSFMNKLPSLDPFLLKDIFLREGYHVHEGYFELTKDAWNEIQSFMLQRFEPLVKAAFPDALSSDEKARMLIDKIWEARDMEALQPLIKAFRLPQNEALEIFSSWRGIVYYSYQYQTVQGKMIDLVKWLKDNETPVLGISASEAKEMVETLNFVRDQVRVEWQNIEKVVRAYQDSYDKMFKDKSSSAEFLNFLRTSSKTYWSVGNSLGKANHGIYCWDVMSNRYDDRKVPWPQSQTIVRLLAQIFQVEKKTTTSVSWS